MRDQLILYDQAVLTWVASNFPSLLVGRTTQLLVSTPRKGFSEVTTGVLIDNRSLAIPRIVVQRLGSKNDPSRYNPNRIRNLGYSSPPNKNSILSGRYPAPISISYQIDFWTTYISEMNLWERQILETFASSYIYLRIHPNDVWGDKIYYTELEGDVVDNSDLEPGEDERQIRKTITLRSDGWFFDDDFISYGVVKSFETIICNTNGDYLDTSFLPPIETIALLVNGTDVTFTKTLDRSPVLKNSLVVYSIVGGKTYISEDNGSGSFSGDQVVSGSVDYDTGTLTIKFSTPPDKDTAVTATYFTDVK